MTPHPHTVARVAAIGLFTAATFSGCGGEPTVVALDSENTVADISSYWTPGRMASTTPVPRWGVGDPPPQLTVEEATGTAAKSFDVEPSRPSGAHRSSSVALPDVEKCTKLPDAEAETCWSRAVWAGASSELPARTVGRIFFDLGSGRSNCTAAAVTSTNESLVWTSAHCLQLMGVKARNIVFVPGYRDGQEPFGKWAVEDEDSIYMLQSWIDTHSTSGEFTDEAVRHDVAALVVETNDGRTLTDSVGSQGIRFEEELASELVVFGYPANAPFDGTTLYACSSAATGRASAERGTGVVATGCDMTGGASGGPMVSGSFEGVTGWGWIVANNSGGPVADVMYGPRLGEEARELWEKAQAAD